MAIHVASFGSIPEGKITEYTLDNGSGMALSGIDYGAAITRLFVPGRHGAADVVLGFDSLQGYLDNEAFIGAIVGRYANRIAGARFVLDGVVHQLDANEPPNHLHGGFLGFHRCRWLAEAYMESGDFCLRMERMSGDGEGGYPGNLDVVVIYRLTTENTLAVEVTASTDRPTPVSVAQHSYFNLAGHNSGTIGGHRLQIASESFITTENDKIPNGTVRPVAGTPFDFRNLSGIGGRQSDVAGGFDCTFVLEGLPDTLREVATLFEPQSGRVMKVATTMPGLQFYDGSNLAVRHLRGKDGAFYPNCAGLCLETQHFPDAVNQPHFPSPILRPGESYRHVTTFSFSVA